MPVTRPRRVAAVALATTAMVAGVTSAAVAGHGTGDDSVAPSGAQSRAATAHRIAPAVALTKGHTLKNTYFSQGSRGGASVAAGFQTVDDVVTVKCPKTCYIDGDEGVQQVSSTSGNQFGLTIRVDGVDQTTPYIGSAPTSFGADTWHTVSGALKPGTHTVQTVIFTAQGTALYNYSNVYRLYQP